MAMTATQPPLSERGAIVERHWQELAARRRMYTGLGAVILILAITGSLWFANETNAGKFSSTAFPTSSTSSASSSPAMAGRSAARCSTCPRPMTTAA